MNLSVPLGFIFGILVIGFATMAGVKNPQVFLSTHAAGIVVGGTFAAAMICIPFSHIKNLLVVFLRTLTGRLKRETVDTINEVVHMAMKMNDGQTLGGELDKVKNAFLKESLILMEQGGLSDEELSEVLEKRVELQNEQYKRDGTAFKIIGKFPPAFGLVGTTVGMITLLQGLGEPNAFESIGPAMSIALVATLYGLVMSNLILIPFGESLAGASEDDLIMRRIVVDGVRLIKERKHPLLVEEYLKSYLAPADRNKMMKVQTT